MPRDAYMNLFVATRTVGGRKLIRRRNPCRQGGRHKSRHCHVSHRMVVEIEPEGFNLMDPLNRNGIVSEVVAFQN